MTSETQTNHIKANTQRRNNSSIWTSTPGTGNIKHNLFYIFLREKSIEVFLIYLELYTVFKCCVIFVSFVGVCRKTIK